MDPKDYLMEELWLLLDEIQRQKLVELAELLAQYAPPQREADQPDGSKADSE